MGALCQFHLPTCDSPQHPIPSKSHSQHPLRARCAACRGRVLLLLPSGKQSCRTPLARLHVHSHDELLAVCLNSTRRICPTPPPTPLLPTKAARSTLRPRVNTSSSSIPASQTQMNLKSQHICRRMVSRLP